MISQQNRPTTVQLRLTSTKPIKEQEQPITTTPNTAPTHISLSSVRVAPLSKQLTSPLFGTKSSPHSHISAREELLYPPKRRGICSPTIPTLQPPKEPASQLVQTKTRKRRDPSQIAQIPSHQTIIDMLDDIKMKTVHKMYGMNYDETVIKSSIHKKQLRKTTNSNSTYFGVVKNKDRFSTNVFVYMVNKQVYLGTFNSPEEAAFYYDLCAIQLHGLTAKTNYPYSKEAILEMLSLTFLKDLLYQKYFR